jgi:hypothetical protein
MVTHKNVCRKELVSECISVRKALPPVMVEFSPLETEHLPAREKREEGIRAYRKSSLVSL